MFYQIVNLNKICAICLLFVSTNSANNEAILSSLANDDNHLGRSSDNNAVLNAFNKLNDDLSFNLDLLTSGISSKIDYLLNRSNVTYSCANSLRILFSDAKEKKTDALKVLSSWGKFPPSGFMSGTMSSLGAYDQCIDIDQSIISTNYCTILFRPLLPVRPKYHRIVTKLKVFTNQSFRHDQAVNYLTNYAQFFYYTPLRIGICLPSICTISDVSQIVDQIANDIHLIGEVANCESKKSLKVEFTTQRLIAAAILLSILLMTILGTLVESFAKTNKKLDNWTIKIFTCFSLRRNLVSLFNGGTSNDELRCLNGIRCLSMSWIIFGHTSLWTYHQAFSNTFRVVQVITPLSSQALLNVTLSVDTFFLISGLLTSYVTWKTMDNSGKNFNAFWFIVSRYIRLTPALICSICLIFFLPYFGSGPIWNEIINPIVRGCENNWWINLLYLQAFVKPSQICIIPTWWLSNDMLFHLISLIVLLPLMKSARLGFAINLLIIFMFAIATAIIDSIHNYPPAIVATAVQVEEYWLDFVTKFFWKPYLHGPPFFIGLFLGYLLAKRKFIKLQTIHIVFWWAISLSTLFFVLHAPYSLTIGDEWPRNLSVLFNSTNRILWSLSIAWIIYASASGYGGWFYDFLGNKIFAPFAKITYCVYLTHMIFIWIFMATRRELQHTSVYTVVYMFLPHWLLAQFLGIICAALFEAPFLNIQKMIAYHSQTKTDENVHLKNKDEIDQDSSLHQHQQQEMIPL